MAGLRLGTEVTCLLDSFSVMKLQSSWDHSDQSHSGYILVVDDNEDTRDAFQALLETWGYVVKTADCGQRALDIARADYPAVAFIDLSMPGMNGYETASRLRKLGDHRAKFFAVSACMTDNDENELFDDLFQKPINLDLIWKLLKALSSTD